MAAANSSDASAAFALRSAALTLVSLLLKTPDLSVLSDALEQQFAGTPDLFNQEPVVVDLSPLRDDTAEIDFVALVALLRTYGLQPVAVKGGSEARMASALAAGLAEAPEGTAAPAPRAASPATAEATAAPVAAQAAAATAPRTLIIDRPLRSGQQVYAKGADLVLLQVVSFGAEVIADGSIHVYAPLRGRAIAGAKGDEHARIFALSMEPQLVSIAGTYKTFETPLPPETAAKAAQVRLDGERLVVEALTG